MSALRSVATTRGIHKEYLMNALNTYLSAVYPDFVPVVDRASCRVAVSR